jgi:hypothetical protein
MTHILFCSVNVVESQNLSHVIRVVVDVSGKEINLSKSEEYLEYSSGSLMILVMVQG